MGQPAVTQHMLGKAVKKKKKKTTYPKWTPQAIFSCMLPHRGNSSPTALRLLALHVCVCGSEVAFIAVCIQSALNEVIAYRCVLLWFQGDWERRVQWISFFPATSLCAALSNSHSFLLLGRASHTFTPQLLCRAEISPPCVQTCPWARSC